MLSQFFHGSVDTNQLIMYLISVSIVVFLVMPIHEWAHGFAAYKLGDYTAKWSGRLKFSPLAHIDPFGAICIVLFGFGWAKPVPVDPRNFKNPKRDMAITAIAGPLSNILMGIVFAFIYTLIIFSVNSSIELSQEMINFFGLLLYIIKVCMIINFNLALFNLIPIPPLDGSKILYALLPNRIIAKFEYYQRYSFLILVFLVFVLPVGRFISNISYYLIDLILNLFFTIFGI